MSWNYRVVVIEHNTPDGDTYYNFGVSEVYYDKDGSIQGYTAHVALSGWEYYHDLEGTVELVGEAFQKPVLYEYTSEDGSTYLSEKSFIKSD